MLEGFATTSEGRFVGAGDGCASGGVSGRKMLNGGNVEYVPGSSLPNSFWPSKGRGRGALDVLGDDGGFMDGGAR